MTGGNKCLNDKGQRTRSFSISTVGPTGNGVEINTSCLSRFNKKRGLLHKAGGPQNCTIQGATNDKHTATNVTPAAFVL